MGKLATLLLLAGLGSCGASGHGSGWTGYAPRHGTAKPASRQHAFARGSGKGLAPAQLRRLERLMIRSFAKPTCKASGSGDISGAECDSLLPSTALRLESRATTAQKEKALQVVNAYLSRHPD